MHSNNQGFSRQPCRNPAENKPHSNLRGVHDDICLASQGDQAGCCRKEGATKAATSGTERLDSRFGGDFYLLVGLEPLDDGQATFGGEAPRKLHSQVDGTVPIQGIKHPDNAGWCSLWQVTTFR